MVTVNKIKSPSKPIVKKEKIMVDPWGSKNLKILIYGRSGTGKTTLWSTFPGPILALLCSGGLQPGELKSIDTPENRKKIFPKVISSTSQIKDMLNEGEFKKYQTIVLDHATGFQDMILKEVLELDEIPVQKSWGIARVQDWGQVTIQCKELLRAIISNDCNLVIIAHERDFKPEDSDELSIPHIGAALTPGLTGWVNGAVDYIGGTFIRNKEITKTVKIGGKVKETKVKSKEVEYCLRTGPHESYQTKFRSPKYKERKLPQEIIDPTYDKIIELI